MSTTSQQRGPISAWGTPVATWGFLTLVAVSTTQAEYRVADLTALAVVYAALALALIAAARVAGRHGPFGRLAGSGLVGIAAAWHLREQTRLEGTSATLWTLDGLSPFLLQAAALGAVIVVLEWFAGRNRDDPAPLGRTVAKLVATAVLFFAVLAAAYHGPGTLRWHLLRHNKMIGTVSYHLFAEPVADIEAADWAAHRRGAILGQPDWVRDLFAAPPAAPRPDIVFVMLDTLRADALAAYGGNRQWMPRLNALAGEAVVFTDVLANAPWTQPSVGSFFTGLAPEEHGAVSIGYRMSGGALTLAELLDAQGYETAAFVANSVIVGPERGFERGFASFEYLRDPQRTYARADRVTDAVLDWLAARPAKVAEAAPLPGDPGSSAAAAGPPTAAAPAAAEPVVASAAPTQPPRPPVFLYVHYLDPHVPYLSSDAQAAASGDFTIAEARDFYRDELAFLDAELARLIDNLDRELPGPRVLFVTSDHGEEFGEHDGIGHSQTLYGEVLEIPAVLRLDGQAGIATAPLEGRDFFELLLRLGTGERVDAGAWAEGAARPARIASLQFEKDPGRSELVHSLVRPYRDRIYNRMIRRDDWRYIRSAFGQTDELYSVANDPFERRNVAPDHPEVVAALAAELDGLPPFWTELVPLRLTDDAIEQLRQLGYIRRPRP